MPSLKARMAAFQAAASPDKPAAALTTPKKKTMEVLRSSGTPSPRSAAVVTPTSSSSSSSSSSSAPRKIGKLKSPFGAQGPQGPQGPLAKTKNPTPTKGPPPEPRTLSFPSTPVSPSKQTQSKMSDKAKTALVAPKSKHSDSHDWKYLYDLACQFDTLKAQEADETKHPPARAIPAPEPHKQGDTQGIKGALEGMLGGNFTANGNFLTNEYIGKHLVENAKFQSLIFDFSGQAKLFQRFNRKDSERRNICDMFVDALLHHPRSSQITQLQLANCLLPDEFLELLATKCCAQGQGKQGTEGKQGTQHSNLPKLQVLNLESNLLGQDGILALSQAIADPTVWPRLQFLKLENQKLPLTSTAEEALGAAVLQSPSLVLVSLRVRAGLERQQINNTVASNIDLLRQARRQHAKDTGTFQERKRNDMEQYFDKIAANDPSITVVDLVGDIKYLGLNPKERAKSGAALANNTHVTKIKLVKLKLDDAFAEAFGNALASNATLEQVIVDSNDFTGAGLKSLMTGLGKNTSIVEFQVRHQTKTTSSADEKALFELLAGNTTLTKLGIDLRDQMAKMQLDRKLNENREHQRKLRAAQRKQ